MPDADFERVIIESDIALQVCTAGNLRTTLLCARLAEKHGAFDRFIIGTDTPTGSGIMPLGMLYTIAHLASLTNMAPEPFVCAATGNNARIYGLGWVDRTGQRRRYGTDRCPGRGDAINRARGHQAR
jgi:enamidase